MMLNGLLCFVGWHKYTHRFDKGRSHPIQKTEFSILYYSDEKVVCARCGKVSDADLNKHNHLPEIR
jgi:hypothetical protein